MRNSLYKNLNWRAKILEGIAALSVLALFFIVLTAYNELPGQFPSHFNASGKPDRYSEKWFIWIFPVLSLLVFGGLFVLNRLVVKAAISTKNEMGRKQQLRGIGLISPIKVILSLAFLYVGWQSIEIARGKSEGLGTFFLPIFLGLLFLPVVAYFFEMAYLTEKQRKIRGRKKKHLRE